MKTNYANAFETELSSEMGPTATEAAVVSTNGGPSSPCYLVINPNDPTKREYILFDGTFDGTTFRTTTTTNRYLSGSADTAGITHPTGSVVRMSPMKQHFDDLHDRVEGRSLSGHGHTAGDVTGVATDPHGSAAHSEDYANDPHGNEAHDEDFLPLTGGTLTGHLGLPATTPSTTQAVRRSYLTGQLADYLALSGGTMTGNLSVHSYTERRATSSGNITVNFLGEQLYRNSSTGSVAITWANTSTGSQVRSITLQFTGPPSSVTWPSGTKFPGGTPPDISGETWMTAVSTADGVVVFPVSVGVA